MKNNLFKDLSDFVGPTVVTRDIEFNGKTKTLHFRVLSGAASEELFTKDPDAPKVNKGFRAKVIAGIVCDEKGDGALSVAEAAELPNQFQNVLVNECLDVNGMSDKAKAEAGNVPSAANSSSGPSSSEQDGSLAS